MWILPSSIRSTSVPGSPASSRASNEPSLGWASACAQSLILRSKHSRAPIWWRKWKRESWTRLLSGLIYEPSQVQLFAVEWAQSLAVSPVRVSQVLALASQISTRATSFRPTQLSFVIQEPTSESSKTSTDSSAPGSEATTGQILPEPRYCSTSYGSWKEEVTARRGAHARRLKLAPRISDCGFSLWPTATVGGNSNRPGASEKAGTGLATAAKTWPTVLSRDYKSGHATDEFSPENARPLSEVVLSGLPDQGKSSSSGKPRESSPGSSWATPVACLANEGESLESFESRRQRNLQKGINGNGQGTPLGVQARAWATPRAEMDSGRHRGKADTLHSQIKAKYPTPAAADSKRAGNYGRGNPTLAGSVKPSWPTPTVPGEHQVGTIEEWGGSKNPLRQDSWSTPRSGSSTGGGTGLDGGSNSRKAAHPDQQALLRGSLRLNPQWVATLMGYSIGRASPSCPASVLRNWKKFVTGCAALTTELTSFAPTETPSSLTPSNAPSCS